MRSRAWSKMGTYGDTESPRLWDTDKKIDKTDEIWSERESVWIKFNGNESEIQIQQGSRHHKKMWERFYANKVKNVDETNNFLNNLTHQLETQGRFLGKSSGLNARGRHSSRPKPRRNNSKAFPRVTTRVRFLCVIYHSFPLSSVSVFKTIILEQF